jgi:hypothetical protein
VSEAGQRRRFWINVGEGAAVLAVIISALSYWDAHRERKDAERQVATQTQAEAAFVLTASAKDGGRRLEVAPLKSTQAIQSQQYVFPRAVRPDVVTLSAAGPRIEAGWITPGIGRTLGAAHARPNGEDVMPVAIVTTYVEDGEVRVDRSLYRIGYAWRSRFLQGRRISLEGLSLIQRGVAGDPRAQVDRRWAADPHSGPLGG